MSSPHRRLSMVSVPQSLQLRTARRNRTRHQLARNPEIGNDSSVEAHATLAGLSATRTHVDWPMERELYTAKRLRKPTAAE